MLFASILNTSVMLGNYLQQTTAVDNTFRFIFFLGGLRVKADFQLSMESQPQNPEFRNNSENFHSFSLIILPVLMEYNNMELPHLHRQWENDK